MYGTEIFTPDKRNDTQTIRTMGNIEQMEIIKVKYDGEQPTVSARDLYDTVSGDNGTKGTERFSKWFERYCSYGFTEGVDFSTPYKKVRVQIEGNREGQREVEDYEFLERMKEYERINDF